jgi:protein AaeX
LKFFEINVFGVYVAPISLLMIAAWLATVASRRVAARFGLLRRVWHPALSKVGSPGGSCIGLFGGSRSGGAIGSWSGFVGLPGVADMGTYLLLEFALPTPT